MIHLGTFLLVIVLLTMFLTKLLQIVTAVSGVDNLLANVYMQRMYNGMCAYESLNKKNNFINRSILYLLSLAVINCHSCLKTSYDL